jgi:hypothetical protein
VTSDSERRHREAKAVQDRIAAQVASGEAQPAQDDPARGREVWDEGPPKTDAQIARERAQADSARVARDMASDACTWITDPQTGRRRPVRDWQEV